MHVLTAQASGADQIRLPQALEESVVTEQGMLAASFSEQCMPVVLGDSQSTLPQAQAAELAADPSVSVAGRVLAASVF